LTLPDADDVNRVSQDGDVGQPVGVQGDAAGVIPVGESAAARRPGIQGCAGRPWRSAWRHRCLGPGIANPIMLCLDSWTSGLLDGGVAPPARTRFWREEAPMAKILYATSFGSDDPTRATIPFIAATGAIEAGHEPEIALLGEATYLVKTGMAEQIQGVGFPPLKQLLSKLIEHRVPVYV
jgi:hypothetical protein